MSSTSDVAPEAALAAAPTVLLFPGQGAQYVGMGQPAFQASARARRLFEQADEVLDYPLSALCFNGPAADLVQTGWQQPAILTCSLANLAAWQELHPDQWAALQPACVAGHSLGEYSALVYAGALDFGQAVRLARLRGTLMQQAADQRPGSMAAVLGLAPPDLDELCAQATADCADGHVVVVANLNGDGQTVLSGTYAALERATALARQRGARRVIPLAVAGAFHSPLMASAAQGLAEALAASTIADARLPVVANSTALPIQRAADVRAELAQQVTAPVRWTETMRYVAGLGVTRCVDSGPGETLANLARRIVPHLQALPLDRLLAAADGQQTVMASR